MKTEGVLGFGKRITAIDAKSGKSIWQQEEANPIAARTMAVRDDHLYFFVPGQRLACVELKTGKPVWENKDAAMLAGNEDKSASNENGIINTTMAERPGLLATANAVYLGQPDSKNFYCFSVKDGRQLWTTQRKGEMAFHMLVTNDRLFLGGPESGGVLDPLTGERDPRQPGFRSGCGVFSASAHMMLSQIGGPTLTLPEMNPLKGLKGWPIKTQCHLGIFVADGTMLAVPAACYCQVARGFIALTKMSGTSAKPEPVEKFSADLSKVAPLPVTTSDWPTHRGNNHHSGSSPVDAPAKMPKELWAWKNPAPLMATADQKPAPNPEAPEFKPLPPIAVGNCVFVAAEDGSIRCLDSATGSVKWTAWTDGPIFATPSLADGRLFVGSADGRVYAFEAATGKPLWRSALSPSMEKVMVYGHLQSRWPVNSGILVQDGVAYAAAGLLLQPGTRVVAMDAATGAQKWQNADATWKDGQKQFVPADDVRPAGYMTIFGNKLWVRNFKDCGGGAAFDLATGDLQERVPVGGLRGREIGVVKDKALIYGGRDIYADRIQNMGRGAIFSILAFGADGKPILPGIGNFGGSTLTPAWNDAVFLNAGMQPPEYSADANLECWDIEKLLTYVSEKASAYGFEKLPTWRQFQFPESRPEADIANPTFRLWGPVKFNFASVIIANKTSISTRTCIVKKGERSDAPWKLSAQNLPDGATLWEIELPSQPARDGLCIDRNGHVIVCFEDGSVRGYGL